MAVILAAEGQLRAGLRERTRRGPRLASLQRRVEAAETQVAMLKDEPRLRAAEKARDDAKAEAGRLRDRLEPGFGSATVFMDVDNLLAGQRFDRELEKALAQTDVFLAVISPRWMDLLAARAQSGERDFEREEIAAALKRGIIVIPVLMDGAALPRADALPEDIRDLVMHHTHRITHESLGRDAAALTGAIKAGRKANRKPSPPVPWKLIAGGAGLAVIAGLLVWQPGQGEASPKLVAVVPPVVRVPDPPKTTSPSPALVAPTTPVAPTPPKLTRPDPNRPAQALSAAELAVLKPKDEFQECPECPRMIVVPPGTFVMGSHDGSTDIVGLDGKPKPGTARSAEADRSGDEGPPHDVRIPNAFAVGKFEVTFDEWKACADGGGCETIKTPNDQGWGKERRPVINVSWYDAQEYVTWLNGKVGVRQYRLLTEAEWEYAARAGMSTRYSFGDSISKSQAQYSEGTWGSAGNTVEVGSFVANRFGLHDMHGNVWEWVQDCYKYNYSKTPRDGSSAVETFGCYRVLRGGSWFLNPRFLRAPDRFSYIATFRNFEMGLRVARTINP